MGFKSDRGYQPRGAFDSVIFVHDTAGIEVIKKTLLMLPQQRRALPQELMAQGDIEGMQHAIDIGLVEEVLDRDETGLLYAPKERFNPVDLEIIGSHDGLKREVDSIKSLFPWERERKSNR